MSNLGLIVRELVGLFIDAGSLAIAIIVVVVLAAMCASVDAPPLVTGSMLLLGCMFAVLENIHRATRSN